MRSLALLLTVACTPKESEIDDPQLQASGVALGEQTSVLAAMDPAAEDSEVQSNSQAIGGTLQSVVGQHQAVASSDSPGSFARSQRQSRQTTAEEPVYWDGSELCIDITWEQAGASIVYDVVLDMTTSGSTSTIDGTYDLTYDLGIGGVAYDYDIHAVYDELTTEAGCAISGRVTIDYSIDVGGFGGFGGTNQEGHVVMTYNGCDDVTVTGN